MRYLNYSLWKDYHEHLVLPHVTKLVKMALLVMLPIISYTTPFLILRLL